MPTRNVNLTDELDRFVLEKVESGRYENASEEVCAGLRTLRSAIDAGDASDIAERDVLERVRHALAFRAKSR